MQPRKIMIDNFGPFIHEQVDFSDFQNSGLFLISGKTGAGKTTIFDSLTFALFGETSGQMRSGKEMRSTFASPEEETKVTFEFEHQGLFYEVMRSPEQELTKKRGTGTHIRTPKVSLKIYDASHHLQKEMTKISEVDRFIKELLHLDAKQFFQIILLPQGEFRNFLIASSGDKEKLLRNLFGTELFQRLNEWLKEEQKKANEQVEKLQVQIDSIQKRFLGQKRTEPVSSQECLLLRQKEVAELTIEITALEEQLEKEKEQMKKAQDALYVAKELAKSLDEYEKLQQNKQSLAEEAYQRTDQKRQIEALVWLEKNQGLLEDIKQYSQECQELRATLNALKEKLNQILQQQRTWELKQIEFKTWQSAKEAKAQRHQRVKELLPVAKEYEELQKQQDQLEKTTDQQQEELRDLIKAGQLLDERIEENQVQLTKEPLIHQHEIAGIKAREAVAIFDKIVQEDKVIAKEIEKNQKEKLKYQEALEISEKNWRSENERLLDLKSQSARMQIARLSLDLREDEPCPICGAIDHPDPAISHGTFSSDDIAQVEKELNLAEHQLTELVTEKERYRSRCEQLQYAVKDLQIDSTQLQDQASQAAKKCHDFFPDCKEDFGAALAQNDQLLSDEKKQLTKAKQKNTKLQKEKLAWQQNVEQKRSEAQANKENLLKIQTQCEHTATQLGGQSYQQLLKIEKETAEIVATLTQKITTYEEEGRFLQEEKLTLEERQKQLGLHLKKSQEKLSKIRQNLEQKRQEQGFFVSEEAMLKACDSLQNLPQLQESWDSYQEQVRFTKRRLEELKEIQGSARPDLKQLAEACGKWEKAVESQQQELFKKVTMKENNERLLAEMTDLVALSGKKACELTELQQLSETMNGNNPQKISIERYVLQAYLAEILEVANQRLERLSRGRYQFLLKEDMGSYRSSTGLEIDIYDDDAGASRRAQTLSGGESFIAALALALSLADVIQNHSGGVAIEALFIDEGFGSLDEEALDMALEALEMVENEGRMIGIISHVRALKDQISQQIIVDALGNGQSKIISKSMETGGTCV